MDRGRDPVDRMRSCYVRRTGKRKRPGEWGRRARRVL